MDVILRASKAIALSIVMYFSLQFLGFSHVQSIIFSLVPLVLVILNVFTTFAYSLTGLIFIFSCSTALLPSWQDKVKELMNFTVNESAVINKSDKKNRNFHHLKP
jgi:hypothetical protein